MNLQERYKKEIIPAMKEKYGYKNNLEVPKLSKVVINVGFGRHTKEKNYVDNVIGCLSRISGQKPVLAKAKKSISSFKVRQGQVIGANVTLRGRKMYDFVDKLINISFPRIRDFRGLNPKSMDNLGNLTLGFKENLSFPEVKADEVENIFGMEVCLSNTAKKKEDGYELFRLMGFPFKKD